MQPIKLTEKNNKFKVKRNEKDLEYEVIPDIPERWISDGETITKIDDTDKTYLKMNIPQELHGNNIMNGPLPFLFGLPPEEAHRRFELELMELNDKEIVIKATPRTAMDYQNFKVALIRLDRKSFLPVGVKLFEGEESDQTYLFGNFEINKGKFLGFFDLGGDPFAPNLKSYKETQLPQQEFKTVEKPEDNLPNMMMGLHFKEAKSKAESMGFKVKFVAGNPIEESKLQYTVYRTQLLNEEGQKVLRMTLYDDPSRNKK